MPADSVDQRHALLVIVDGLRGLLLHLMLPTLLQLALFGQVVPGNAAAHRADDAMMAGVVTGNTSGDGARQTADSFGLRRKSDAGNESCRDDQ
jgi:hypothetical protein